jgi:hypothetical protein
VADRRRSPSAPRRCRQARPAAEVSTLRNQTHPRKVLGALVAYRLVPSTTPTANLHLLHGGISLDELSAALTAGYVPADTRPSAQEANATTDQVWG